MLLPRKVLALLLVYSLLVPIGMFATAPFLIFSDPNEWTHNLAVYPAICIAWALIVVVAKGTQPLFDRLVPPPR
jgi:hypothetical protein